jgi:hypothetical protein
MSFFAVTVKQESGDLLVEELDVIWESAPKFPDVLSLNNERIDVDSFIQIYRDIDDLYEDDDAVKNEAAIPLTVPGSSSECISTSEKSEGIDKIDEPDETLEHELEDIFASICDKSGLLSRDRLRKWDEVQKLIEDGLLGEDELEDLWNQTPKSPGSPDQLDVDGFLSFNVALDDLFEFPDEGDADSPEQGSSDTVADISLPTIVSTDSNTVMGDDLPPSVLFAALANENGRVGMDELKKWGELQEMIDEGDLSPAELKSIFERITKADDTTDQLDERGFTFFYEAVDALFDYDESDDASNPSASTANQATALWKSELLSLLGKINNNPDRLPCGLECTDFEDRQVLRLVAELEQQASNVLRQRQGKIQTVDLAGKWELIYTSSSAMKFNKGLSGLGGSFPNGRFAGLVQNLRATKFLTDIEYIERIEVNPSSASFDVKVNGNWDLRSSVSLFTGEPSLVLIVDPEKVTYGPTSTRADHWKSLGPLNMLDITYLDEDIRVMRGNTSTDSIFVFRRSQ